MYNLKQITPATDKRKPFADVTDTEVHAAYKKNPEVSMLCTWDEIKKDSIMYNLIKRSVAEGGNAAADYSEQFEVQDGVHHFDDRAANQRPIKNFYVLSVDEAKQVMQALAHARTQIQIPSGDSFKREALAELYHARQIFHAREA